MALRKFLFQNQTEGFSEEQQATDELSLGKATFAGVGGVAIDAGGFLVSNLAAPVGANDAARKLYVDDADDVVRDEFQAADAQIVSDYQAADAATLASANAYTDGVAAGFNVKDPVRVVATADVDVATGTLLTIDGELLVAGDRVLLTGQTDASENGIYLAATGAWTRATDYDGTPSNEVANGDSIYVLEGTAKLNTTWVLITSNPITIDTTNLTFREFSSLTALDAGAGLTRTGNVLDVGAGDGIVVNANDVAISLASPAGLEFSSGDLRIDADGARGMAIDATGLYLKLTATNPGVLFEGGGELQTKQNATGGLTHTATGDAVLLDGTTLQSGASGLSVKGLPALFEIATVAVGAAVTAPNLDTLTNGSNADALHVHAAASATSAPKVIFPATTSAAVATGAALYWSGADTVATGSSSVDAQSRVIGLAVAGVGSAATVQVIRTGVATGVLTGATANTPYFMGPTGQPVLFGSLASGARTILVGLAKNATDLDVIIDDRGKKA